VTRETTLDDETSPDRGPGFAPALERRSGDGPTVLTLGCRLNAYESEVMRTHAAAAGLEDAVVVNTCAVTTEAVRQGMQTIRRLRRERPEARIVVTGCAAQIEPDRFAGMAEVDHVLGNAAKLDPATWQGLAVPASERVQVDDIMAVRETAHHLIDGFAGRARAFVQVQNGCDHRCTFCIIPFGRGPSRSVPVGVVVESVRRLVEGGCREVVLTGVDITAYGADLPGPTTLGTLVRRILRAVPELPRLRLSSIDQVEADPALLAAIADEERLMPHLHLSLQAGDDMILKRMRRRHDRASAVAFCREVRRLRPEVAFGADLIAGFPTESETMFQGSLELVEECGLAYVHAFPFSPRAGTPAARMPQVARATVKERAERLRRAGRAALSRHLEAQIGRRISVLVEDGRRGRAADYAEVVLAGAGASGAIVAALVRGQADGKLLADMLEAAAPRRATAVDSGTIEGRTA
jgi:threonylcarbamoyladenosine tRNA methylthiotransferase MtaB